MKTKIIIAAMAALPAAVFAQSKVYFDEDWQPTTQDKMVYYRQTNKENGLSTSGIFIKAANCRWMPSPTMTIQMMKSTKER